MAGLRGRASVGRKEIAMTPTRIAAVLALFGLAACAPGGQTASERYWSGADNLTNAYIPRGFPGPDDD